MLEDKRTSTSAGKDSNRTPEVDTGGGAYVEGDVDTGGGTFVGRDLITEETTYDVRGLPNPYLGLRSFTYEDRDAFAGREKLIQEAVEAVTNPLNPQVLTFISGASGSGKSSFAQAGLIPALEGHYQARNKAVRWAVFRPSTNPLAMLADALTQLGLPELSPTELEGYSSADFSEFLNQNTPSDQVNLVIIDQFEEIFYQSPPNQRQMLTSILVRLPEFRAVRTHFLATLRSDYLKELFEIQPLWQFASKEGIELRAMSEEELKETIQSPLQTKAMQDPRYNGKRFQQVLVERLAEDAAGEAAYLPLLQITLQELWRGGSLKLEHYQSLTDAIRDWAEKVYTYQDFDAAQPGKHRSDDEQKLIEDILIDLVEVSLDDEMRRDVRRGRDRVDLDKGPHERKLLSDDLIQARLLSTRVEGRGDSQQEKVDIIHESLIANWDRLQEAIANRRQDLQRRTRFETDLADWEAHGHDEEYLLTGIRLAEASHLAEVEDIALRSEAARDYLTSSISKEEARQRRRLRRARLVAAGLLILSIIALVAAGYAWQQSQFALQQKEVADSEAQRALISESERATQQAIAEEERNKAQSSENARATQQTIAEIQRDRAEVEALIARSRQLATVALNQINIDPERALIIALEAIQTKHTFEAEDTLRSALHAHHPNKFLNTEEDFVYNAQESPDGEMVVTTNGDGTVHIWDTASGESIAILEGHIGPVKNARFFPKKDRIVTSGDDGTARVWDLNSGETVTVIDLWYSPLRDGIVLIPTTDQIPKIAEFSPDGELVVATSEDGTARIWDTDSGEVVSELIGHTNWITSAHFSFDGRQLVSTSIDGTARIWDITEGETTTIIRGDGSYFITAQFSPDGEQVVTGGNDGNAQIWRSANGESAVLLSGHDGPVFETQFSSQGSRVLTASSDGTVRTWDANFGGLIANLSGGENKLTSANYSHDGTRVITGSDDGTTRVWDAESGKELIVLSRHDSGVTTAQFLPDSNRVLTVSKNGEARLWTPASGDAIAVLRGHRGMILDAHFSQDGDFILTSSDDGTARVWEATSEETIAVLDGHDARVISAQYSPNGKSIMTASLDGKVQLWDPISFELVASLQGNDSSLYSAEFSPAGERVLTAGEDGTVRIWDADNGGSIAILGEDSGPLTAARFSPNGELVVAARRDGTAHIWDLSSGDLIADLIGHDYEITIIEFSSDGRWVLTAGQDRTARLWSTINGELMAELRGHKGPITAATLSPDGSHVVTTSRDNTARVWKVPKGEQISVLHGHNDGVWGGTYSPNGERIVTASWDETARVWEASSGQLVALLHGHDRPLFNARFSPNGEQVVTSSGDGTARIYSLMLADLIELAKSRINRELTCEERIQYLNEKINCPGQ